MVRACSGEVVIRHHRYPRVQLRDSVPALIKKCARAGRCRRVPGPAAPGFPKAGEPMRIGRLIGR
jgi:indolepyruvate decarboxylase